ncbi:uncharacterized protein [Typha latifolia]|uniref:uncharacterized protein isoform X1 n=1 Tax=Typha latifolia TaxID=4733 RepID=UPI003C2B823D
MLKSHRHLYQIPPMRSLRNLLHLRRARFLLNSRHLSSNPSQRCSSFQKSKPVIHKPSVWYSSRVWTSYDPVSNRLVTKRSRLESSEEEGGGGEEADSSDGEGRRPVLAYYDPVEERLVARADEEEEMLRKSDLKKVKDSKEEDPSGNDEERKGSLGSKKTCSSIVRRRTGKMKLSFVCENCGASFGQWWGTCRSCHTTGSVKEFLEPEVNKARGVDVSEAAVRSWLPQQQGRLVPMSLVDINKDRDQSEWRIRLAGLFGMEVARVLGGGIVPGSLVLVGGDPGVGKSTLLLQIAAIIAQDFNFKEPASVVYVSGEESIEQIGNRADRMRITTRNLYLYSSTDIEDILDKIQPLSPAAVIIDSIQTVYLRGVVGSAGNIMQVKECTSALLRFAKQTNIPIFLIGHVTKSGDIAGPRLLEHIVDAVLYMEGERYSSYRLLRAVKNRFGSIDELGVFEMSESGLQAVSNPSDIFLSENNSDSEILAGLAVAVVVDGSRTFLLEVQALCVSGSSVAGHVNGIQPGRADMIISVLMKQAGLKLQGNAIFLNVVSGFKLTETAGDLAIAAAICSSFLELPIPNDIAFIGEVGLGGELRSVPRMDKRVIAVSKLGYKKCVVPRTAEKLLVALNLDIAILGCKNLKEVINTVFNEGWSL